MKNKQIFLVTAVLCLLPAILSAAVYRRLPEEVAVHWNSAGQADGYLPKMAAAFGLPAFFLLLHLLCMVFLQNDPKRGNHSKAMRNITLWLIPVMSLVLVPLTLFSAMGVQLPIPMVSTLLVGIVLIAAGNYLPKSRQNYVMGIRLPWTLNSAENWNRTNRLAGYTMMAGGLLILICGFIPAMQGLPMGIVLGAVIPAVALVPGIYSYVLYKKGV